MVARRAEIEQEAAEAGEQDRGSPPRVGGRRTGPQRLRFEERQPVRNRGWKESGKSSRVRERETVDLEEQPEERLGIAGAEDMPNVAADVLGRIRVLGAQIVEERPLAVAGAREELDDEPLLRLKVVEEQPG